MAQTQNTITEAYNNVVESVHKLEIPEGARAFVTRGVDAAIVRAEDMHANGVKATNAIGVRDGQTLRLMRS